jgi:ankyrin repeat protein
MSGLEQTYGHKKGGPTLTWYENKNWRAEDYFDDPQVIELCRAIANGAAKFNDTVDKEVLDLIDKLLAEGADVNAKGKDNMTVLLWSHYARDPRVFEKILKAGADPNVRFGGQNVQGTSNNSSFFSIF